MILDIGEKVHIIERRYFSDDLRRHFIGEVVKCTENAIRVGGYAWIFDQVKFEFVRKSGFRERVFYPGDRLIINIIPSEVDLEKIKYTLLSDKGLVVTDGKNFVLAINEFSAIR